MRSRFAKTLLKLSFGAIILVVIILKVPRESVLLSLKEARPPFFLLALGIYLGGQVLSAYKWRLLAEPLGFHRPFKDFVAFYFIGMFFNLFMLGSIGGDVYRAALLAGTEKSRMRSAYSILAERYTGGVALLSFCALSVTLFFRDSLPLSLRTSVLGGLILGWILLLTLPGLVRAFPWLGKLARKVKLEDFTIYWERPKRGLWVLGLSFCFHTINILTVALLGTALGIKVPLAAYFFIVPVVDIISTLPLSISGLGLREGGYVFMFKLLGIEAARGFACGLLVLAVVLISGLMGAIVYFLSDYPVVLRRKRG